MMKLYYFSVVLVEILVVNNLIQIVRIFVFFLEFLQKSYARGVIKLFDNFHTVESTVVIWIGLKF